MRNDKKLAVMWPKQHWQIAGFICACLPFVGLVLVEVGLMSVRAAVAAVTASIVYVLLTTWYYTYDPKRNKENGHG